MRIDYPRRMDPLALAQSLEQCLARGTSAVIVQPLDRQGAPKGDAVVAGDGVHMAAPGDLVTLVASREAALAMPDTFVPVDDAIVGIVDQLAVDGEVRDWEER